MHFVNEQLPVAVAVAVTVNRKGKEQEQQLLAWQVKFIHRVVDVAGWTLTCAKLTRDSTSQPSVRCW